MPAQRFRPPSAAPAGGFRFTYPHPWVGAAVQPRPSPTVMRARRSHYTRDQEHGYRLAYTIERLSKTRLLQWPAEFPRIGAQWQASVRWAQELKDRHAQ